MSAVLLVDVGNHSVKAALVQSGRFADRWVFPTIGGVDAVTGLLEQVRPAGIAYASVVPAWTAALRALRGASEWEVVEASHRSPLPFRLLVDEPENVGPDRICAAVGAWTAGAREAVIVDIGTALTVDLISGGAFRGGSIFPGSGLLFDALHRGTAKLPLVGGSGSPPEPPGANTGDAVRAGVWWGLVGAVKELVSRSLPDGGTLWLTGGDAERFAPHLGRECLVEPDLVLRGLLETYVREIG